ncbi:MAG: hypothetical protein MZW92_68175 [Comamonadaceae bacterium]|nr:hypothetical protein [Comamonadaceae bacterium]
MAQAFWRDPDRFADTLERNPNGSTSGCASRRASGICSRCDRNGQARPRLPRTKEK